MFFYSEYDWNTSGNSLACIGLPMLSIEGMGHLIHTKAVPTVNGFLETLAWRDKDTN